MVGIELEVKKRYHWGSLGTSETFLLPSDLRNLYSKVRRQHFRSIDTQYSVLKEYWMQVFGNTQYSVLTPTIKVA